jgi:hypothetical protein
MQKHIQSIEGYDTLRTFQAMSRSPRRYEGHRYYQRPEKGGIAIQRKKIIKFYERYGEKATLEAFGVDRKVINRWRKRLKENKGKIIALLPLSTRPKRVRKSIIPHEITEFIKAVRKEHPKLGKEKIKPLLDEYCKDNSIKTISESTIGNIIKRYNFFFQKDYRLYDNLGGKEPKNNEDVES